MVCLNYDQLINASFSENMVVIATLSSYVLGKNLFCTRYLVL